VERATELLSRDTVAERDRKSVVDTVKGRSWFVATGDVSVEKARRRCVSRPTGWPLLGHRQPTVDGGHRHAQPGI
jgi:hypothetical protein